MKYSRQIQEHIDRLDQALFKLRDMIKRGENEAALNYMENGPLKDRFDELQNTINMSSRGSLGDNLGAMGTQNVGNL